MKTHPSETPWVNVAVFDDLPPGQALQTFLDREGFNVRIHDERKIQRYWFFSPPRAAIQVQAREDVADDVTRFLETSPKARPLLRDAIYCPSCHSTRVQYPQMTRKFLLPTLFANLLVLLHFIDREYYCEDCHYEWATTPRPAPVPEPLHRT
jgi:hypothetical protein